MKKIRCNICRKIGHSSKECYYNKYNNIKNRRNALKNKFKFNKFHKNDKNYNIKYKHKHKYSGASVHITYISELLTNKRKHKKNYFVNGECATSTHIGDIYGYLNNNELILYNVLLILGFNKNLISICQVINDNYKIWLYKNKLETNNANINYLNENNSCSSCDTHNNNYTIWPVPYNPTENIPQVQTPFNNRQGSRYFQIPNTVKSFEDVEMTDSTPPDYDQVVPEFDGKNMEEFYSEKDIEDVKNKMLKLSYNWGQAYEYLSEFNKYRRILNLSEETKKLVMSWQVKPSIREAFYDLPREERTLEGYIKCLKKITHQKKPKDSYNDKNKDTSCAKKEEKKYLDGEKNHKDNNSVKDLGGQEHLKHNQKVRD
ncbi:hypothetical protein PIROE2DRAFT_11975 [Piromyces sp. E2]|nr:hypothetical protein PIROE2DRAFT_11975 [Piromyces sp. E2]|eukprot:OUM61907.1 hypothetical protein PIROE2DRAFT_11975 [Piromyces sp. E2]